MFKTKKSKRIVVAIIAVILILAMVLPMILAYV